jgi:hypothetical protein
LLGVESERAADLCQLHIAHDGRIDDELAAVLETARAIEPAQLHRAMDVLDRRAGYESAVLHIQVEVPTNLRRLIGSAGHD